MKKEDFVSTLVMTTVSILMLVGVTIAWYTAVYAHPTVTGMNMEAGEQKSIRIALEKNGEDVAVLRENDIPDDEYVKIGLEYLVNIENGQMAPGAYGKVVFYVTSLDKTVTQCRIVPSLMPGYEEDFMNAYADKTVPEDAMATINGQEKKIAEVLDKHFDFYQDEAMTDPVSETKPFTVILLDDSSLLWDESEKEGPEIEVTLYWKWHYEDPDASDPAMSAEEKKAAIYGYDMEDTWIGTHLKTMAFHFDFWTQGEQE